MDKGGFLRQIWEEVINSAMSGEWIEATLAEAEREPDAPFADVAGALQRLLAQGADREDLCRLVRWASFESSFITLDMLRDPTIDKQDHAWLHENLLDADPSGMSGRPGSWPA